MFLGMKFLIIFEKEVMFLQHKYLCISEERGIVCMWYVWCRNYVTRRVIDCACKYMRILTTELTSRHCWMTRRLRSSLSRKLIS